MANPNEVAARLWVDDHQIGDSHPIVFSVVEPLTKPPNTWEDLGRTEVYGKVSSMQWDCPPGIELVFGENLTICPDSAFLVVSWKGQYDDLEDVPDGRGGNWGDRIKCWMWRRVH